MGIDITTYRCRIGSFHHEVDVSKTINTQDGTDSKSYFDAVACMLCITMLLSITGSEPNYKANMDIDITTYRCRIGSFHHEVDVSKTINTQDGTGSKSYFDAVACMLCITMLLSISGIEPNPGPMQVKTDDLAYDVGYQQTLAKLRSIFCRAIEAVNKQIGKPEKKVELGTKCRSVCKKRVLSHCTASVKCWPRVFKSQELIQNLIKRCIALEGEVLSPGQEYTYISDIELYIESSLAFDAKSILFKGDGIVYLEVLQRYTLESFSSKDDNFAGLYIDSEGVKPIELVTAETIVVLNDTKSAEKHVKEGLIHGNERTKHEISSILEQVVFKKLITKYNILRKRYANHNYKSVEKQRSTLEQLLGEMTTMFKRSTLPKHKIPNLSGIEKQQVSKEVTRQLFRIDKTIRACGYSNNTFNVNVESLSNEEDDTDRKRRIKDFLARYGVTDVKFNTVSKDVSEYKYVGATVATKIIEGVENYAHVTLGGFASMELEESTCVIFSRHLGMGCNKKLYVNDNGHLTEFGEMIEGTFNGGGYDIAAAKVYDHHASTCDFQFKNSDNSSLPGNLQSAATDFDLQYLSVHLWGAVSKPGLGTITIPELFLSDDDDSYMQIEDREPPVNGQAVQRMAVPGDSGAVVCADDLDDENVNVIAMLIGTNNENDTRDSPATKGTYVAFPLQEGMELLRRKTNRTFSLKGVSNN